MTLEERHDVVVVPFRGLEVEEERAFPMRPKRGRREERAVEAVREAITEIPREPAFAAISEETRPEATRILPERSIPERSACPAIRSRVLCRPVSSANRRRRSPSQAPAEWIPPLPWYASDARASASIAEKSDSGDTSGPAEGS